MSTEANALPLPRVSGEKDRPSPPDPDAIIRRAEVLRRGLTGNFRDEAVSSIYAEAERLSRRAVRRTGESIEAIRKRVEAKP